MRRKHGAPLLISIAALALIVSGPVWSVGDRDSAQAFDILVDDLQGKVDVHTRGQADTVAIGSVLDLPSRIVTGDDGEIQLRQGRTRVGIASDSDVEIPEAAGDGQLIARMVQHRGSASYDVETRPLGQMKLTVETPYLVAVVKGTQFDVVVVNDTTTISLFEGQLEIRTPDGLQSIQLNAGEIAIRSLADDAIRRLPMNPDLLDDVAWLDGRADGRSSPAANDSASPVATVGSAARVDADVSDEPQVIVAGGVSAGGSGIGIDGELSGVGSDAAKPAVGTEFGANLSVTETLAANVDTRLSTQIDLGDVVDVGLDTRIDTGVDLGGAGVDVGLGAGLDAGIDLGGGTVDVGLDAGLDAGVDLGGAGVDVGLDAGLDTGIDLGGGTVDLGLDTGLDTGVDLGGTGVDLGLDAGLDTGIDLGGGTVDLGLDVGLDTGIDLGGAGIDTGLDVGVDAGLDAGLDTGVDLGLDAGLDTGLGLDVDLGLDVGLDPDTGLDLGLDLGLGGTGGGSTGGTGSTGGGTGGSGGGLLGGVGGLLGL